MISPELRTIIRERFRYDPFDEQQVFDKAKELVGKTIVDILQIPSSKARQIDIKNKGDIGNIIQECWFGIPANPSEDPDFPEIGIELKILPLMDRGGTLVVKERTKICSINYFKLLDENWASSHAKRKLEKIIFVYYRYNIDDRVNSKVVDVDVWNLNNVPEKGIIEEDWCGVKDKISRGQAHELSESQSRILAACRSGQGKGRDLIEQPRSRIPAQKRAFALKQSFTQQRWREYCKKDKYESVIQNLRIEVLKDFEIKILGRLHLLEGRTLEQISQEFGIKAPNGKNAAATIIKKALGFKHVNSNIKEFDQFGISIRSVPVRPDDDRPWEDTSFPAFKLKEVEQETWEDASIREYIERVLFVPIYEPVHPGTRVQDRKMGHVFFWSPNESELETIKKEWERYQFDIKNGKCKIKKVRWGRSYREATGLMKGSETEIIHVRPHGRDSSDRDVDSHGNSIIKQSFWLNKKFVQKLIQENRRAN